MHVVIPHPLRLTSCMVLHLTRSVETHAWGYTSPALCNLIVWLHPTRSVKPHALGYTSPALWNPMHVVTPHPLCVTSRMGIHLTRSVEPHAWGNTSPALWNPCMG
jgi:hypothetical protein